MTFKLKNVCRYNWTTRKWVWICRVFPWTFEVRSVKTFIPLKLSL